MPSGNEVQGVVGDEERDDDGPSTTIYLEATTKFVQTVEVPIAPVMTSIMVPPEWFTSNVRKDTI